jgi:Bifunctional DNA primase/polymerase, N-terminal
MNDLLLTALDCLARGWSVVPVQGKQPLERWQQWQHHRMTNQQAKAYFTRPECTGVAVVCGAVSSLTVLDFDGLAGRKAFLDLYGQGLIELTTPTVITGSGGYHLYFSSSLGERTQHWSYNGARAGEVRSEGAYVLAPPSRHPNGKLYQWSVEPLEPPRPMSAALRDALGLGTAPHPPTAAPKVGNWIPANGRVSLQVLLKKAYDLAPQDGRNNTGFKLATWLRDNGYSRQEAYSVLLEYCHQQQANGKHQYTPSEAAANVRSAYSRPAREPWMVRQ